ncbi:type VI secretion system tip protein VgrG [Alphaproteobacteria bacterium KMM 3653]|uniref:Type VI secretion system tip protein VgrG n=1 Tax=Harenicola maris TaxID=2841044 RepID=A0AAP2CRH8_9RHOB|nr:type VI secretion system tip protein VgrG [Harenicola maris]
MDSSELVLMRFNGMDGVNQNFEYQVEALSDDTDINLDALIGHHMTVELTGRHQEPIYYDGIVVEAAWADDGDSGHYYRFTLRPWFWLMSRRRNNKIWQNKSFEQIAQDVCGSFNGDSASSLNVSGLSGQLATEPHEYIVQYGESDMHFLCRLAERFGVNYYFKHSQGQHELCLVDMNDNFPKIPGGSREYIANGGDFNAEEEHFSDWSPGRRLTTGVIATTDYNFKTPSAGMNATSIGDAEYGNAQIESYDYPGGHLDQNGGTRISQLRIEQERARDKYHTATGTTITLSSGMVVELTGDDHEGDVEGKDYICIKALHSYSDGGYRSGGNTEGNFRGSYEFAPMDVPFAPERKTYETRMSGPQTALVVGPAGEEIHVDQYGRIKVQFYWDRLGSRDENSSMWVRCAQMWAGAQWGALFTPRIGMEVVVEFLEGDPNQPLIVGCVYNAENMPPYPQPGDKNWNGIKSNTTKGGGGYNELVFNDTKGEELFRQHAQFDMETKVLNDERRHVLKNRNTNIDVNETRIVGQDEAHTIKRDSTYTVERDETTVTKRDHSGEVGRNQTLDVAENQTETVGSNREVSIGSNDTLDVGNTLEIEAGSKIKLKVGGSSIEMDSTSITIKSLNIKIDAGAKLDTNGGGLVSHKAGGVMTVKGALVKIN